METTGNTPSSESLSIVKNLKSNKRPKLPSVQEALQEAAPMLQKMTNHLDRVSSEIKEAEAALKKHGLPVEVFCRTSGIWDDSFCEVYGKTQTAKFITWLKDEHGNFRLQLAQITFNESRANDVDSLALHGTDFIQIVSAKPLIECSVDDRLSAWKDLPKFLGEVQSTIELALI